ncbi:unnamed protein product [Closterium sp. NIES-65]|nr:unnamed protein product [Closterium sp. NIES-65]
MMDNSTQQKPPPFSPVVSKVLFPITPSPSLSSPCAHASAASSTHFPLLPHPFPPLLDRVRMAWGYFHSTPAPTQYTLRTSQSNIHLSLQLHRVGVASGYFLYKHLLVQLAPSSIYYLPLPCFLQDGRGIGLLPLQAASCIAGTQLNLPPPSSLFSAGWVLHRATSSSSSRWTSTGVLRAGEKRGVRLAEGKNRDKEMLTWQRVDEACKATAILHFLHFIVLPTDFLYPSPSPLPSPTSLVSPSFTPLRLPFFHPPRSHLLSPPLSSLLSPNSVFPPLTFGLPSSHPLGLPSSHPLGLPSSHPLGLPSSHPLGLPSSHPLGLPSSPLRSPLLTPSVSPPLPSPPLNRELHLRAEFGRRDAADHDPRAQRQEGAEWSKAAGPAVHVSEEEQQRVGLPGITGQIPLVLSRLHYYMAPPAPETAGCSSPKPCPCSFNVYVSQAEVKTGCVLQQSTVTYWCPKLRMREKNQRLRAVMIARLVMIHEAC